MTKKLSLDDFRAVRHVLEPSDFALGDEEDDPSPTDQIEPEIWNGIMHLPDDVAIRISDHNGTRLRLLYSLWGDWIEAVGDPMHPDELFSCMLDANDCFQCANFAFLHGFYRSAISNLRTSLELVMIGAFANLQPQDAAYLRWKQGDEEKFGFSHCRNQLRQMLKGQAVEWLLDKAAFPAETYAELCKFTHARPDSSDGALWKSNGPVFNNAAILKTFKLSLDVYATCYLLVKIGRPSFTLPSGSKILFELDWMTYHADMLKAYKQLNNRTRP
jgi:hypothetical protein